MLEAFKLLVLWEYKTQVPTYLEDIPAWHLHETLLQAYYLRTKHSYPIWHCLTDLKDFHHFLIEDDGPRTLKVVKYIYVTSNLREPSEVFNHINFLFQSVSLG